MAPVPIEELPKKCMCGRPLTYSKDLVFVSRPISMYEPDDIMEEMQIPVSFVPFPKL